MSWDIDNLTSGAFIEFKKGSDKGTWKVVEIRKFSDGQNDFYRAKIDKDLNIPGDEKFVEWYENEPLLLYVFDTFQQFDIADSESWPPPEAICLGEGEDAVDVRTMDKEGFIAIEKGVEFIHYEYLNEKETLFLSIWNENDLVTMRIGYCIEVGFLNLI